MIWPLPRLFGNSKSGAFAPFIGNDVEGDASATDADASEGVEPAPKIAKLTAAAAAPPADLTTNVRRSETTEDGSTERSDDSGDIEDFEDLLLFLLLLLLGESPVTTADRMRVFPIMNMPAMTVAASTQILTRTN